MSSSPAGRRTATTAVASAASESRRRAARRAERLFGAVVRTAAFAAILAIVLIFVFVGREALPLLRQGQAPGHGEEIVSWASLAGPTTYPDRPPRYVWQPVSAVPKYNLLPLVVGTLKTTLVAILFAGPLAVLAAILTSEFAPRWVSQVVKPTIELLAGIPSVVLGFFALMVLATWLQGLLGVRYRLNALTAGIGLGLAVIPIIYTVAEDALAAVPRSYREASYALGASRWETAVRIVVPAALPGIFAGVALGFGRAVGETMIVLMASGNAALATWPLTDSVRTLSATIAAELGEVVFGGPHYRVLFLLGVLLFVFTFAVNLAGELTVRRLRERLGGRA
ncbi:phosphate ABC transporter permease subunit PstC [bacterium]|nr:phosphate ABC transporter permease subunit PstC [bacterium]